MPAPEIVAERLHDIRVSRDAALQELDRLTGLAAPTMSKHRLPFDIEAGEFYLADQRLVGYILQVLTQQQTTITALRSEIESLRSELLVSHAAKPRKVA